MDDYKIIHIKDSKKNDITDYIGALTWKDSIDTLGMELSFTMIDSHTDKYMNWTKKVTLGDFIVLLNKNKERFRGLIVTENYNINTRNITAFDFAFWLNKSMIIKQFTKMKSDKAIMELCKDFNIKVSVKGMTSTITKIYKNSVISDIIKDIIENEENTTGKKFRMEMRNGILTIEPYKELIVQALYKQAVNIGRINSLNYASDVNISRSIENMRNSILITSGDEKTINVMAKSEDKANIKKYGLLTHIESVDDKSKAQASNIAKNKLKELNKIGEDISLTLLGSDELRAGRILIFNNEINGLKGKYLIKDCEHKFENKNHKCNITIEVVA